MIQTRNIIEEINESAAELSKANISEPSDIDDQLISDLIDHYSAKISSLAYFTYGATASVDGGPSVSFRSFVEEAKAELRKGLYTFIFTSQHWRAGRDINSYLLTCLNRLSERRKSETDSVKRVSIPVCPACKTLGNKEFMSYESRLLRCNACTTEVNRIEHEIKSAEDEATIATLDSKLRLHKIFALHSRRGYRCSDCERFIPDSFIKAYGAACPYDDCTWFGTMSELEPMAHPLGLSSQQFLSLNTTSKDDSYSTAWQDSFKADTVAPDLELVARQKFKEEYDTLKDVIHTQMERVRANECSVRSLQKVLMYQTYANMLDEYPDDMVSYLVHMKHSGGSPIQSRIFQEYIKQIENNLPFSLFKGGKEIEIYSLQDPNLNLFLGISEFDAEVKSDYSIPNNTKELYVGGRKLKNYGPCFIGMVFKIEDEEGNSLMDQMDNYTFVKITMKDTVQPGTKVKVTHFRTHSHYEMGGLVPLQRLRRKIVDSVYKRLNGKTREVQRNGDKKD